MKKYFSILITALAAAAFSSCVNTDAPEYPEMERMHTDFATIISHGSQSVTFQVQEKEDSPVATMSAPVAIDPATFPANTRALVTYIHPDDKPYESSTVTLCGLQTVYTKAPVKANINDFPEWDYSEIYLHGMWRTGKYLNISCTMNYVLDPGFGLIIDEATIGNQYPDIYMTYLLNDTYDTQRPFYASVDISEVWDIESCRGLRIHLNNSNGEKIITINKQSTIEE